MKLKEMLYYKRELYIILITLIVWSIIALINNNFANIDFMIELIGNNSVYFICALGVLPLMIMGGIDLSVGGMMMMTSVAISFILGSFNMPALAVLIIGAIIGLLLGAINGQIITRLKVSSIIATLAMLSIYTGISKFWYRVNPAASNALVNYGTDGVILGEKLQVLMIGIIVISTTFILNYSKLGRKIYAIGGNSSLAKRKGLDLNRTLNIAYAFSGLCAGIAAFMQITLLGQTQAEAYGNIEFELIIIVIIGGLNIMGGYGSVMGTFFAAALMIALRSGMVFARIPVFWHDMLIGVIIISIVSYDMIKKKMTDQKLSGQGGSVCD